MSKMPVWFKIIWMVPILINIAALIWFILGSTGGFQRGQDLIETVILMVCGIPSIIIVLISLTYIWQGWAPFSGMKYIVSVLFMASLLFFLIIWWRVLLPEGGYMIMLIVILCD